ncbi:MAG: hypothetical protein LBJ00_08890 [Planctomycetaceae bacterium]|nr:hypothetical protein [Planctomycetaceae bacterium]
MKDKADVCPRFIDQNQLVTIYDTVADGWIGFTHCMIASRCRGCVFGVGEFLNL